MLVFSMLISLLDAMFRNRLTVEFLNGVAWNLLNELDTILVFCRVGKVIGRRIGKVERYLQRDGLEDIRSLEEFMQ